MLLLLLPLVKVFIICVSTKINENKKGQGMEEKKYRNWGMIEICLLIYYIFW